MITKKIHTGIEEIVRESKQKFGENLKCIILFGSTNNSKDFVQGLSDIDFIYLLSIIRHGTLQDIAEIRKKGMKYTGCKVDIKPLTLSEFNGGIRGIGTFEFFNGWGLEMIKNGNQKCLYNSGDVTFDYPINQERIKKDSLERAHHYITRLRKLFSSNEKIILRGEHIIPDDIEKLKFTSSSIKNVLVFCLAYKGIIVNNYEEVKESAKNQFGDIEIILELFKAKKDLRYNNELLLNAYNRIEEIYSEVINC